MAERVDQVDAPAGPETSLVEQAKRGDLAAFEELMRAHQRLAFRAALAVTRDRSDAEEAVQDGFLRAFGALQRFRRGSPFRPWLLKIVLNEAKNKRRVARRHAAIADRALSHEETGRVGQPGDEIAIDAEQREALICAIDGLGARHRDVVTCRYLLELSEEETAAVLSLRPGTVKSRLSRALARLELELEGVV